MLQVLGIETSCDDTGIALYNEERGLLAHKVHIQIDNHAPFGGVVPELASRDHVRRMIPLLDEVLRESGVSLHELSAIAYTKGPGLHGSLLVGAAFAKALSYACSIPSIGINHLEGHLLSSMLENKDISFPFLGLVVSGGHSMLVRVEKFGCYHVLGDCVDDAAGEAFDKIAKLLGLSYPGGKHLEELAKKGDPKRFKFPRPLTERVSLDFSFSGLKTSAIKTFRDNEPVDPQTKADIACALQAAIIDTVYKKCKWALETNKLHTLIVTGGVSANHALRDKLNTLHQEHITVFFPSPEFCTDNGAMIAYAGLLHLKHQQIDRDLAINVNARLKLKEKEGEL